MAVSFEYDSEGFERDLRRLEKSLSEALQEGIDRATRFAHRIMIESISRKGKGRIYQRGTITHQASAPYDPPASDTGGLRRSIKVYFSGSGTGMVGGVQIENNKAKNSNATYIQIASWLEFGTRKTAPRPFIRPAYFRTIRQIEIEAPKLFTQAIRRALS